MMGPIARIQTSDARKVLEDFVASDLSGKRLSEKDTQELRLAEQQHDVRRRFNLGGIAGTAG